ncbi:type II CAAX prenyl endopeptidase Rce1 family protein [Streptomyces sp. NPDC088747]|uniref:CPBP family glutamic-type intramembrane protease n=1 Tax=Streptomyces sp. NPDC088747 TaxID=3365886 RepID=UPI00382EAC79
MAGLLLLACILPLAGTALIAGAAYGVKWAQPVAGLAHFGAAVIVFFWLSWTVIARTTLARVTRRRRLLERGAAVLCGAAAMFMAAPFSSALARNAGQTVFGCVLAWLAIEVARAHGARLGGSLPATASQRLREWQIAHWVLVACLAGGVFAFLVVQLLASTGLSGLPTVKPADQMSVLGIGDIWSLAITVVGTVAVEDVVIIAATVTLLTAARRPAWQIYTAVCTAEVLLHAYLGLAAVGAAVFAAGRIWLYLRYRSLLPLIAAHALFDLSVCLQWIPAIYRWASTFVIMLADTWLHHRLKTAADKDRPPTPPQDTPPEVTAAPASTPPTGRTPLTADHTLLTHRRTP